MEVNKKN